MVAVKSGVVVDVKDEIDGSGKEWMGGEKEAKDEQSDNTLETKRMRDVFKVRHVNTHNNKRRAKH